MARAGEGRRRRRGMSLSVAEYNLLNHPHTQQHQRPRPLSLADMDKFQGSTDVRSDKEGVSDVVDSAGSGNDIPRLSVYARSKPQLTLHKSDIDKWRILINAMQKRVSTALVETALNLEVVAGIACHSCPKAFRFLFCKNNLSDVREISNTVI
ncbi:hypothetical protein J6590_006863 [Homalodisca vitripennis]|nr:hypothetical protein J6590_006863 [Homalodisca vitripennis]